MLVTIPPIGILLSLYCLTLAVQNLHLSYSLPNPSALGLFMFVLLLFIRYILLIVITSLHLLGFADVARAFILAYSSYGYLLPPNG